MEPTREIYWNITGGELIYVFFGVALIVLAWGIWRRARLWRLGRSAPARLDRLPERLAGALAEIFAHRRLRRRTFAGRMHGLIFWGFLALVVATSLISLQEWSGLHFLRGDFYLGYSLLSDGLALLGIVGLGMALWRRWVVRPPHLHTVADDWLALLLLLVLFVQGFVLEGARIAVTELEQQPGLAPWSPGGYAVAWLIAGLGHDLLTGMHQSLWWVHAVTAFAFIGYLGHGKLSHVLYAPFNIVLRNLDGSGKLIHPDIEAALDADPDALEDLGVSRIDQFDWKQLLDLDTCLNCGRCEEVCPASLSGVPLSPRKLIQDLKQNLHATGPGLLAASGSADETAAAEGIPLVGEAVAGQPGPSVLEEEIWGCRTCGACQTECPVHIEHIPKIVDIRRDLVMNRARMSDGTRGFLKNLEDRMHPWAGTPHDRDAWFADLDLKVFGRGDAAEYLFWVGCTGALVDRNIEVTRAVVRVLQAGGVDFAVLGAEETCTGDPARRVGEELAFQTCARTNVETLARYGIDKIITTCPHCFNTMRNEYPDFDGHYQVIHHTELIAELIRDGRIELRRELDSLTYHDPCYLGRHNGVYDAPRRVLGELAANGGFVELERNRSKALCCGAGGGHAWMDDSPTTRINHMRLEDVRRSGATTTAVSCPFCLQMFDEALGARDPQGTLRVADIAELVADALAPKD